MSTAGILRPDEVVFYHPLDNFTEHTQSQAWTGSGGFVPGRVGSANSAVTADTFSYGSLNNYGSGMEEHEIVKLDSSHAVMTYKDSGQTRLRVCTVSGNDVTLGPAANPYGVDSNGYEFGLTALDSSRFFHATRTGNVGKCVIGTVSGTDITFGTIFEFAPFVPRGVRASALDSSTVVVAYSDYNGAAEDGYVKVAKVSGTDITFGTKSAIFDSGLDYTGIGLCELDSTHGVVSWRAGSDSYLAVVTVSGMDATVGAAVQLASDASYATSVAKLTSSTVVVAYGRTTGGNSPWARVGTVSGSTVTVGPETWLQNNSAFGDIAALDSTSFAILYFSFNVLNRAPAIQKGIISGTSITFGSASSPWTGTGANDNNKPMEVCAMDSGTILAAATRTASSNNSEVVVGQLGMEASMTAPTPGAYPSTIGDTRVVAAMWAKNLTAGSSTVTVERGYKIDMTATTVSLGGTTAVWSDAGISSVMATMNDGSDHLLVLCFENTSGTNWNLSTSVDGAAFVDQGAQDSGTQAVTTADTAPKLEIADGESGQWVDELAMWSGDKAAFDCFTTEELANLNDLADTFGETMDKYEENYGAPICWQATAVMPDGTVWRDSGSGPCPAVIRVPRGATDIVVTDEGRVVSPRIQEG